MRVFATSVSVLTALLSAVLVSAKNITIVVGGNGTTQDASLIFQPQEVQADVGDFVIFNFTNGTHTVIQSTFAEPCLSIHESNSTLNGFNSGLRNAVNGTANTTLAVEVTEVGPNTTIWFYDLWGCGQGGVGAINANDSDWENFDAFVRNAERLNGTGGSSSSATGNRPSTTRPVPTSTAAGNSAESVGANAVKIISIFTPILLIILAM